MRYILPLAGRGISLRYEMSGKKGLIMTLSTRRKIYYTSVIAALVAILCCAVIINRTLVNTPKFSVEEISLKAGEPVNVYMAYVDEKGEVVVGIAEKEEEIFAELVSFAKNIPLSAPVDSQSKNKTLSAWMVLYDEQNRIASRMNFYDNGTLMWYDGESYVGTKAVMDELIRYCDLAALEEEEKND